MGHPTDLLVDVFVVATERSIFVIPLHRTDSDALSAHVQLLFYECSASLEFRYINSLLSNKVQR